MDPIAEGRAAVEQHGGGFAGKLNAYECDGDLRGQVGCRSYIVTIDRDTGVTPFMLKCGNCGAYAHSKFYRVSSRLQPTHEWYRPDSMVGIDPAYAEHISKGGLILRPLGDRPDCWLDPSPNEQINAEAARAMQSRDMALASKMLDAIGILTEKKTQEALAVDLTKSRQQRRFEARKGRR